MCDDHDFINLIIFSFRGNQLFLHRLFIDMLFGSVRSDYFLLLFQVSKKHAKLRKKNIAKHIGIHCHESDGDNGSNSKRMGWLLVLSINLIYSSRSMDTWQFLSLPTQIRMPKNIETIDTEAKLAAAHHTHA